MYKIFFRLVGWFAYILCEFPQAILTTDFFQNQIYNYIFFVFMFMLQYSSWTKFAGVYLSSNSFLIVYQKSLVLYLCSKTTNDDVYNFPTVIWIFCFYIVLCPAKKLRLLTGRIVLSNTHCSSGSIRKSTTNYDPILST